MADFSDIPNLRRAFSAHSRTMEIVAGKVRAAAKQFAPNMHIRNAIRVDSIESSAGGKITIVLRASTPDARAYEYGSGIHSRLSKVSPKQLGPKGKILIKPTGGKKVLAFPWDVQGPGIPRAKDGRVILPSVEHPGVAPANGGDGYLRKAVKVTKAQAKKDVAAGVAGALKLDIKAKLKFRGSR